MIIHSTNVLINWKEFIGTDEYSEHKINSLSLGLALIPFYSKVYKTKQIQEMLTDYSPTLPNLLYVEVFGLQSVWFCKDPKYFFTCA